MDRNTGILVFVIVLWDEVFYICFTWWLWRGCTLYIYKKSIPRKSGWNMKMIQFNRVHVYRFMIPKTGFVWSKLSTVFYRQPLAGVDEKTGQVLVQVSEKYFRPTEVQFVTQLPMMSDEGVMILESRIPKNKCSFWMHWKWAMLMTFTSPSTARGRNPEGYLRKSVQKDSRDGLHLRVLTMT